MTNLNVIFLLGEEGLAGDLMGAAGAMGEDGEASGLEGSNWAPLEAERGEDFVLLP